MEPNSQPKNLQKNERTALNKCASAVQKMCLREKITPLEQKNAKYMLFVGEECKIYGTNPLNYRIKLSILCLPLGAECS